MGLNLLRRPSLRTALIAGAAAFGLGMLTSAWTQSGPANTAHFDVYAEGDTIHLLTGHGKKGGPSIFLFHRVSKDGGLTAVRDEAGGTLVAKPPALTVLWLEGSPWNGARRFANRREVPSAVQ